MIQKNLKRAIISIPGIGYVVRIASNLIRLPRLSQQLQQTSSKLSEVQALQQGLNNKLEREIVELTQDIEGVRAAVDNLLLQINNLKVDTRKPSAKAGDEDLFADDHIMDNFYTSFEDHFRGTEAEITKRLEEYLPYFLDSKINFKSMPVLDIGSGRGELLALLQKHNVSAVGLDINLDMVDRSVKKGLKAEQGDALAYLQAAKSKSYGAITGFHIVEHIPFNILLRIFKSARRVLADEGFVIFETPNPENVIVGAHKFYLDPSHLHPLPPTLLAFALETCGFKNVTILRLHPDTSVKTDKLPKVVANRFFGPMDYAVVGYK